MSTSYNGDIESLDRLDYPYIGIGQKPAGYHGHKVLSDDDLERMML
jgi:hypothetical protein